MPKAASAVQPETTIWASGFEAAQRVGVPQLRDKSVLKFGTRLLSVSTHIPATCVTHRWWNNHHAAELKCLVGLCVCICEF